MTEKEVSGQERRKNQDVVSWKANEFQERLELVSLPEAITSKLPLDGV